jgi:hypothetical protein
VVELCRHEHLAASLDDHLVGGILTGTDGLLARLAQAGLKRRESASRNSCGWPFLDAHQEVGIHVADLLVQAQAVEIAKLRENGDGLLACHVTDRNTPTVRADLLPGNPST